MNPRVMYSIAKMRSMLDALEVVKDTHANYIEMLEQTMLGAVNSIKEIYENDYENEREKV